MTDQDEKHIDCEDLLWTTIVSNLPSKRKQSGRQFININCPMCMTRGETPDRKMRCGIIRNNDGVGVNCFNCGFATRWKNGHPLSRNLQEFLSRLGVSSRDVKKLNYYIMKHRQSRNDDHGDDGAPYLPVFGRVELPQGARRLEEWADAGCDDGDFLAVVDYLFSRGDAVARFGDYYWTPETDDGMHRRLIVPFHHRSQIVGFTARAVDKGVQPRYWSNIQPHFLFNNKALTHHRRRIVIVTEGVFDAMAVDGVATLGAKMTPEQASWISQSGKEVIVLPDRDTSGRRLIDVALKHGWAVSFPQLSGGHGRTNWWEPDVKDAADAARRYGRLWTIRSVVESAASSRIQINMLSKLLCE